MTQLDRRDIEVALPKKSFEMEEESDHRFFHLKVGGRATGIKTYTSRGSGYKVYSDSLLGFMARQLHLAKADLVALIKCPLDGPAYLAKLREKGIDI
jgi:hypothetical protein